MDTTRRDGCLQRLSVDGRSLYIAAQQDKEQAVTYPAPQAGTSTDPSPTALSSS